MNSDTQTESTGKAAIFRSVSPEGNWKSLRYTSPATRRVPQNVPLLVDNLWEWRRPEGFPNRRFSAFASPTAALASKSAPGGVVCRAVLKGTFSLCQLKGWTDSKFHPECKSLPKLLAAKLGSTWTNAPLDHKQEVGRLWMPCLTKAEVQSLFETVDTLKSIRQEIEESVTYWKSVVKIASLDCMIDIEGELFFEAPEGYELIRVENG